jgi:hypothetical protein
MKTLITTLSALAFAGTLAIGEDKPPGPPPGGPAGPGGEGRRGRGNPEEAFKKLDSNNDSSVSLEEFKAGPAGQRNPERAEAAYKRMDKDSDGKLTLGEFKAGRPPRPDDPGVRPGGGRGGDKPGKPPGGGQ